MGFSLLGIVFQRKFVTLAGGGLLLLAGGLLLSGRGGQPAAGAAHPQGIARQIVARGRIEPLERVIALHGAAEGSVIARLLVDQGDKVEARQVLAVLDGYDQRQADIATAEANLRLAELELVQTKAGAKHSELAAQKSAVLAKDAQRERLLRDWDRRKALYQSGYASEQSLEGLKADLSQAENESAQASHTLKALGETRDVDAAVASARIEVGRRALDRARVDAEHMLVRAPTAGTILSIQARAGEVIGSDGLLRMAPLSHIIVVAEVNEADAPLLQTGMAAEIEGLLLLSPLHGSVSRIAKEVFRQKRPSSDVLIGRDAKIVEAEITTDQPLPEFLGGEVLVRLMPPGS